MSAAPLREDPAALTRAVKSWALELGFADVGISGVDIAHQQQRLAQWLSDGLHAGMTFMENHQALRLDPPQLHPGTQRIVCVRMDYLPESVETVRVLNNPSQAYISRYALGRDYHKTLRKRLAKLARRIEEEIGPFNSRPFVDSAPVMEKPMAQQAGLGWQGKNSLILNRQAGSYFVLGELFTDLPLVIDPPYEEDHCRRCQACLDICPTQAFVKPYVLDAGRCISYLTIEHKGSIPEALRPLMGNRVFGCDDCQLVCPWNRYSHFTREDDFQPRNSLEAADLIDLFGWDEETFLARTQGSAIRRTGHIGWLRNLAVALGNSAGGEPALDALKARADHPSELVREHVHWAISRLQQQAGSSPLPLLQRHERKVRHLL